jgi:hypothetical protein
VPISVSHVVEALEDLGGEAQIGDLLQRVLEIAPEPHPKFARNVVRGRLYQFSSQTSAYKPGTPDLFESVDGLDANTGRWRLKGWRSEAADPDVVLDEAEAEIEAPEGRRRLRVHLARERSRSLIKAFKDRLSHFACEACGTDMGAIYGELGQGYIEAHHRRPVSEIVPGEVTKLSDLAALCPNCHRMIHRNGLISVEELALRLKDVARAYPMAAEAPVAWVEGGEQD